MQSESAGSIFSSEISAIRPANESATLEEGFSSFRNSAPQSRTAEESESGRKGLQISKNIFFDRESASWIMLSVWEKRSATGWGGKRRRSSNCLLIRTARRQIALKPLSHHTTTRAANCVFGKKSRTRPQVAVSRAKGQRTGEPVRFCGWENSPPLPSELTCPHWHQRSRPVLAWEFPRPASRGACWARGSTKPPRALTTVNAAT